MVASVLRHRSTTFPALYLTGNMFHQSRVFRPSTTLILQTDQPGAILTAGGRVLGVTAHAESLARAKLKAYEGVKEIRWRGAWCRKDIADKGLRHEHEQVVAESAELSSSPPEGTA